MRSLFIAAGIVHLAFGVVGVALPSWFFAHVPPWPPLHVGQIQIGGVFDLTLAAAYLGAATDARRYAPLMIAAGVVAEWGHALVRLGHIVAGDNDPADWVGPAGMLVIGAALVGVAVHRRRG